MRYTLYIICLFLLVFAQSYGQTAKIDTTNVATATTELEDGPDGDENLSEDVMLNPADTLYNHIWDHINLNYNLGKISLKDTLTFTLVGDHEGPYSYPLKSNKVISEFRTKRRPNHTGIDVKLSLGDSVFCTFNGKVRLAKRYNGYGNLVLVRHPNGLETVYAHLSKILVKENQIVKAGQVLGLGGRTGRATTEHLHFEARVFGKPVDPAKIIDFSHKCLYSDTYKYYNRQPVAKPQPDAVNGNLASVSKKKSKPKTAVNMRPKKTVDQPLASVTKENSSLYDIGKMLVVPSSAERMFYNVRKGDTMYNIAKRFGTSIDNLCRLNNCTPRKVLHVGTKLIVK